MIGYIYCISNTINNKLYVGKTLSSIEDRFKEHCKAARKRHCEKRPLYRAMIKYGIDKFSIHEIERVDCELLEDRELFWIQKLNTYNNGYNATHGGDGKLFYDENDGLAFKSDYESGLNIKQIAQKHNCNEKTIRKRLRALGLDSTKQNYIQQQEHQVLQYDLNGNLLNSFFSQREAARFLINNGYGTSLIGLTTHIGDVIRGKRKTCAGYVWKEA